MVAARRDPDFFIVARTDAMGVTDLDDAIARLEAYAAAGADGLYVDPPRSVEQLKEIARRLKPLRLPLLFNMVRSGKSPFLTLKEVYELGFDYALCPVEPMLAMHKAVKQMMETRRRLAARVRARGARACGRLSARRCGIDLKIISSTDWYLTVLTDDFAYHRSIRGWGLHGANREHQRNVDFGRTHGARSLLGQRARAGRRAVIVQEQR
jgi:hypothetical protein